MVPPRRTFALSAAALATAACLPSYSFQDAAGDAGDASADGAAADAASTPETGGAGDAGPGDSMGGDATGGDAIAPGDSGGGADSAGDGASPAGVTLDPGFPRTAQISHAAGQTLSVSFDVPSGGRMIVAVVVWGQWAGSGVWPVTFASPHLTWTNAAQSVSLQSYTDAVGVGVWTAWSPGALSGESAVATRSPVGDASDPTSDALVAIYSLAGASQTVGATGTSNGFGSSAAPLSITIDAQAAGSYLVGGLLDGNGTSGVRGNTLPGTVYDRPSCRARATGSPSGTSRATPRAQGP